VIEGGGGSQEKLWAQRERRVWERESVCACEGMVVVVVVEQQSVGTLERTKK